MTQAPSQTGFAVMGLAASERVLQVPEPAWRLPVRAWLFLLIAGVVFLVCTGILMLVSTPRRSRRLAKVLLALVAGSACGALWILLVGTALAPALPDAMNAPAVRGVGVVTALAAASLLAMPTRLSAVVGRSAMVVGFHCLALPIAACISLVVRGARVDTALAGDWLTGGLSVGGLLVGVGLVFVGDRALRRRRRRRPRARFDLSGPHP
jgi:hypothetical protein